MIKKFLALNLFILSLLSFSAVALATNGEGFTIVSANPNTINPRRFIFEVKPGQSVEDFVEIQNMSESEETFLLYGADPTFSAQGTPAYKTRQAGGNGEGKWILFDETEVKMAPNEKRIVRFTLRVPETAAKGDYRAGIAMEKAARPSAAQPGISIATRIILHAEIKVTDNPRAIPHVDGTISIGETEITTAQQADWRTLYFWISLVLFICSFVALLFVTLAECFSSKKMKKEIPPAETAPAPVAKPAKRAKKAKKSSPKEKPATRKVKRAPKKR